MLCPYITPFIVSGVVFCRYGLLERMNRYDVGMLQAGSGLGFTAEACQASMVGYS